jgi:hypothetical protein
MEEAEPIRVTAPERRFVASTWYPAETPTWALEPYRAVMRLELAAARARG